MGSEVLGFGLLDPLALDPSGTIRINLSRFYFGQPSSISALLIVGVQLDVQDLQLHLHFGHSMSVFDPVPI